MKICGCCHQPTTVPILESLDCYGKPIQLVHCLQCCALTPVYETGNVRAVEMQTSYHENLWERLSHQDMMEIRKGMGSLLSFHSRFMPDRNSSHRIYDIGAGRGNLLASLIEHGFNGIGCEPSKPLVTQARDNYQLTAEQLAQEQADTFLDHHAAEKGEVDVIFFWHVLEHMEDPVGLLHKARSFLKKTGVFIAQGPLLSVDYCYPEHFFLHSESNITWLANELNMKVVFLEAENPERFISFVLARPEHPETARQGVLLRDPLAATGALYYTYSQALKKIHMRR
ncbi:hypothetical protein BTR14_07285 [Rhizobium rhizosphaerae]|uniref:Uncharacterized protein n=1 Tax=Xaviernesmea rhizosphaerae TaxID=1672749 RepID=A0ABX3PGE8_9HYPH|nr:class I SAM-dependent methyltransferase [Xaviernesmea rhizosphaerae]OQP87211.1 hypothetical protein BTR14_07285 [Xaviernesmea rhizosphaerae]